MKKITKEKMKKIAKQFLNAIEKKDIDKCRELLRDNPTLDINTIHNELNYWEPAIHKAARIGSMEIVKLLLENGTEMIICNGKNPIHIA